MSCVSVSCMSCVNCDTRGGLYNVVDEAQPRDPFSHV